MFFLSLQAVMGTDSFPKLHFYLPISVCLIPAGGGSDPAWRLKTPSLYPFKIPYSGTQLCFFHFNILYLFLSDAIPPGGDSWSALSVLAALSLGQVEKEEEIMLQNNSQKWV